MGEKMVIIDFILKDFVGCRIEKILGGIFEYCGLIV